jgi:hypothetical protein
MEKGMYLLRSGILKDDYVWQLNIYRWLLDGGCVGSPTGEQVFWPVDAMELHYLLMNRTITTGRRVSELFYEHKTAELRQAVQGRSIARADRQDEARMPDLENLLRRSGGAVPAARGRASVRGRTRPRRWSVPSANRSSCRPVSCTTKTHLGNATGAACVSSAMRSRRRLSEATSTIPVRRRRSVL